MRRGRWSWSPQRSTDLRLRALLVAVALSAGLPAAARGAWASYGHDLANSRNGGPAGPSPAAAARLAPVWSFASTEGDFTGTPVIAHGVVVVGSAHGVVYALDESTGALRWSRTVGPQINASALIDHNTVYVPVNDPGRPSLVALRLSDGAVRWQRVIDSQPGADVFGSPVISRGLVYLGISGAVAEHQLPPLHARGGLAAVDARTGRVRWHTYTVPPGFDGGPIFSTPAIDAKAGMLYVGTGNAYTAPAASTTDSILMINARTGGIRHHFQASTQDATTGPSGPGPDLDFGASPNLFTDRRGRRLVGEGQKTGRYWAFDRRTLRPVWHADVGPSGDMGGILGSTAWDGHVLYGPETATDVLWSLSSSGAPRWSLAGTSSLHVGSVSVANGVVYSNDYAGNLIVRSAQTGELLTTEPLGAPSWGGVAIADGFVVTVTGTLTANGAVKAFRPRS